MKIKFQCVSNDSTNYPIEQIIEISDDDAAIWITGKPLPKNATDEDKLHIQSECERLMHEVYREEERSNHKYLRTDRKHRITDSLDYFDDEQRWLTDEDTNPEKIIIGIEDERLQARKKDALNSAASHILTKRQYQVYELAVVNRLSTNEIAAALSTTKQVISNLKSKYESKLRKYFSENPVY